MFNRTSAYLPLAALLALGTAACTSPFGPTDVAGVYALSHARELPSQGTRLLVLADTIAVMNDLSATRRIVSVALVGGQPAGPATIHETVYDYRMDGRAIGLLPRCTGDCASSPREWFVASDDGVLRTKSAPSYTYLRVAESAAP